MTDIIQKLSDLLEQATKERSHYYVARCCSEAIAEILRLRVSVNALQADCNEHPPTGDPMAKAAKKPTPKPAPKASKKPAAKPVKKAAVKKRAA